MKNLIGASLLALTAASGPAVAGNGFLNIPETPDNQMPPSMQGQATQPVQTMPSAGGGFSNIPETLPPTSGRGTSAGRMQGPAAGFNSGAAVAAHIEGGLSRFVQLNPDAADKLRQQVATIYDQELGRVNPGDKFINVAALVKNTGTPDPAGRVPYVGAVCAIPLSGQAPSCSFTDAAQTSKTLLGKVVPDEITAKIRHAQPRAVALANGAPKAMPKLGRPF